MEKPVFRYSIIDELNDNEADDDTRQLWNEYKGEPILNLIKALDKERAAYNKLTKDELKIFENMSHGERHSLPDDERHLYERNRLRVLRKVIALRLDVLTDGNANHLEYMLGDWFVKPINALEAEVKELRAIFKSHNHEIGGVWTSSARWTP